VKSIGQRPPLRRHAVPDSHVPRPSAPFRLLSPLASTLTPRPGPHPESRASPARSTIPQSSAQTGAGRRKQCNNPHSDSASCSTHASIHLASARQPLKFHRPAHLHESISRTRHCPHVSVRCFLSSITTLQSSVPALRSPDFNRLLPA
jgi:hypothetical protein